MHSEVAFLNFSYLFVRAIFVSISCHSLYSSCEAFDDIVIHHLVDRQRRPFLRASAMLKHVIDIGWTSVCPSVRPSHAGTVSKRLNILS